MYKYWKYRSHCSKNAEDPSYPPKRSAFTAGDRQVEGVLNDPRPIDDEACPLSEICEYQGRVHNGDEG